MAGSACSGRPQNGEGRIIKKYGQDCRQASANRALTKVSAFSFCGGEGMGSFALGGSSPRSGEDGRHLTRKLRGRAEAGDERREEWAFCQGGKGGAPLKGVGKRPLSEL
jgi:hypothetical protein